MPADDQARLAILTEHYTEELKAGTLSRSDARAKALEALARMEDGTDIIEVTFEGGATRASVNCPPHILLAAIRGALNQTDPANPFANASERHIYADHSGGRIET